MRAARVLFAQSTPDVLAHYKLIFRQLAVLR